MAKRQADSYLTDRNWDEEDEQQEAGQFKQADDSTISKRKIKTAKRRNVGEGSESSGTGGIFKCFTGFTSSSSTPKTGFSFGGIPTKTLGCLGGSSSSNTDTAKDKDENGAKETTTKEQASKESSPKNGTSKSNKSKYTSQLRALNSSVAKWITEHVDSNPYCILTPIFTDYEKHLEEIEMKYGEGSEQQEKKESATTSPFDKTTKTEDKKDTAASKPLFGATTTTAAASTTAFTFGAKTTAVTSPPPTFTFGTGAAKTDAKAPAATFKFGTIASPDKPLGVGGGAAPVFGGPAASTSSSSSSGSSSTTASSATSSFGGTAAGTTATFGAGTSGFTFGKTGDVTGSASGFTFGNIKPAASGDRGSDGNNAEEEEYVPPEPEPSSVTEDDAFYTKRCKMFYKVGSDWKDYGVGNLFLKPCDGKTQLLVRADTSLGNILLNILIPSSLPASRNGKNNVLTLCIPNPPLKDKSVEADTPVSMLIRVKTSDEADELLSKLNEAKKQAEEKE